MTLLSTGLWIPFPDCNEYAGCCSIAYGLVFAYNAEHAFFGLMWLTYSLVVPCLLIYFTILILRKDRTAPFLCLMATDLAVTLIGFIVKLVIANYLLFPEMILGFVLRTLYFLFAFFYNRNIRKKGD